MKNTKKQLATLFELARMRNWSPMWTHYYRRDRLGNRVLSATSCVLVNANAEPVSRGFCSVYFYANGEKAYGRMESLSRAFKAAVDSPEKEGVYWLKTSRLEGVGYSESPSKSVFPAASRGWTSCENFLTLVEQDRIAARVKRVKERGNLETVTGTPAQGAYNSMAV